MYERGTGEAPKRRDANRGDGRAAKKGEPPPKGVEPQQNKGRTQQRKQYKKSDKKKTEKKKTATKDKKAQ